MIQQGLEPTQTDPCFFFDRAKTLYAVAFVDDVAISCKDKVRIDKLLESLKSHFELTTTSLSKFVGLEINREPGQITITSRMYIGKILERFRMMDAKVASTPCDPTLDRAIATTEPVENMKNNGPPFPYREAVGALNYLAITTRPDIAYAVNRFAQFNNCPSPHNIKQLKAKFKYLKGTRDVGIIYKQSSKLTVQTYSDSDWASDKDSRKSRSGYYVAINGSHVTWSSRKQSIVALSTCEAEFISVCQATQETLFIQNLLQEIGINIDQPIELLCDNQSAIANMLDCKYSHKTNTLTSKSK